MTVEAGGRIGDPATSVSVVFFMRGSARSKIQKRNERAIVLTPCLTVGKISIHLVIRSRIMI